MSTKPIILPMSKNRTCFVLATPDYGPERCKIALRHSIKIQGMVKNNKKLFDIEYYTSEVTKPADRTLKKLAEWGLR